METGKHYRLSNEPANAVRDILQLLTLVIVKRLLWLQLSCPHSTWEEEVRGMEKGQAQFSRFLPGGYKKLPQNFPASEVSSPRTMSQDHAEL